VPGRAVPTWCRKNSSFRRCCRFLVGTSTHQEI